MSVGAVNKQTGDRIPTAGMPAIDDALDLTSVNPVQNAIITAALANKQDKTDNSLQTTDKTVVGAINEHEGDISSLKSGLTNVDVALSVPENSGKNVLPLTLANLKTNNTDGVWSGNTYNRDNVAFTVQTDVDDNVISINVSGTASANTFIILDKGNLQKYKGMILNGCPVGGSENTYNIKLQKASGDYAVYATDIGNGYTLPNSITSDNTLLFIRIVSGYNAENLTFAPMIRPSYVSDPTFAPYIPSVDARLDAVESGLTDFGTYSITPVKIGTWFGNDLYRKIVDLGSLPNAGNKSVDSGLSGVNVIRITGTAIGTEVIMPMPYVDSNTIIALYYDSTAMNEIKIVSNVDATSLNGYAIIDYILVN